MTKDETARRLIERAATVLPGLRSAAE